jgi:hypothetical protein
MSRINLSKNIAPVFTTTRPVPTGGSNSEMLTCVSNNVLDTTYSYYGYDQQGSNMFPSLDITSILPAVNNYGQAGRPFAGASLAPNGKIYMMPNSQTGTYQYIILDTYTDTYVYKNSSLNWQTGSSVCAHNGKIYAPTNSGSGFIRVIDTLNNDLEYLISVPILRSEGRGFIGANLGVTGKVYCTPSDFTPASSAKVMVINPVDDNVSFIDVSGINWDVSGASTGGIGNANGDDVWYGGALAPNGKIYCPPARGTSILVIDTNNDTAECDISGLSGFPTAVGAVGGQANKYGSAALAPNGKIYAFPGAINIGSPQISRILEIDPSSNTCSNTSMTVTTGVRNCVGGTLAPDGRIYASTDSASAMYIINTNTTPYTLTTLTGQPRANGTCLGPNGKLYIIPQYSGGSGTPNFIRVYKLALPVLQPWMMAPEFNNY